MNQVDELRRVFADFHNSLALAQELALKLLDAAQPDAEVMASDIAAQHRRLVGDAIARIEASEAYVASLWKTFNVDRRKPGKDSQSPVAVLPDRRKNPRSI